MQCSKPFFILIQKINKSCIFPALLILLCTFNACIDRNKDNDDDQRPFLNIENGQFDVVTVLVEESGNASLATPYGLGSISFDYSGDISGTFSVSDTLVPNQTEKDGVLAILDSYEDEESGLINEGLYILGFHPTGEDKADVFLLKTKTDTPLLEIESGNAYTIGPFELFNGFYLKGLSITKFWEGKDNFAEIADKTFELGAGIFHIVTRDSTHFTGTFEGTTHTNQNTLSKHNLLR